MSPAAVVAAAPLEAELALPEAPAWASMGLNVSALEYSEMYSSIQAAFVERTRARCRRYGGGHDQALPARGGERSDDSR
jgi:hypothetical protein